MPVIGTYCDKIFHLKSDMGLSHGLKTVFFFVLLRFVSENHLFRFGFLVRFQKNIVPFLVVY
jgi:hypothetical protein